MRNFEITKREVLASISIIAVMILVGILISAKITERQMDRNEVYNKAVKIDSQETFSYGMRTKRMARMRIYFEGRLPNDHCLYRRTAERQNHNAY